MSEINDKTRLVFVDPCSINQSENTSVPLTPQYEDMCLAFNLYIETYSRLDKTKQKELGLLFATKPQQTKQGVSTLGGTLKDSQNNTYLSTFYTEISPDSYEKGEMVEGLGVESVEISYASYYNPTVIIKFVDVRGSALFGREEYIHTSETGDGKINADNIFGAFFTVPYPKFKLQVKGFYGRDVTYQLTVSNFKAEMDTNTGNIVAIVSFVGYNWALLTDIPLDYLIAAPYCDYVGENYWQMRVNQGYFVSDEGLKLPKLADFLDQIQNCMSEADAIENKIQKDNEEGKNLKYNELTNLQIVKTHTDVLTEGQTLKYVDDITKYKESMMSLGSAIHNYIGNDNNKDFKTSQQWWQVDDIWFVSKENDPTLPRAYKIEIEGWNDFIKELNEKIKVLNKELKEETETAIQAFLVDSVNDVGMKPTIHNVFKMLMCHLDTFCHIMFQANQEIENQIYNSQRTPEILGVQLNNNDLPPQWVKQQGKDFQIPAWTAITNSQPSSSNMYDMSYNNEIVWIGKNGNADNWVESKVVLSLQDAIKKTFKTNPKYEQSHRGGHIDIGGILTVPSDLHYGTNPFSDIEKGDYSSVVGLLGIRATQLFGVIGFSKEQAEKLGMIDAFNYMLSDFTVTNIKNFFGSHQSVDLMKQISTCSVADDENATKYNNLTDISLYTFENRRCTSINNGKENLEGRNPIFQLGPNGNYSYVYFFDENNEPIVPSKIDKSFRFPDIKQIGIDENSCYYEGKTIDIESVGTDDFLAVTKRTEGWLFASKKNYKNSMINNDMAYIVNHQETVQNILEWYKRIVVDNKIKIKNKEYNLDIADLIQQIWQFDYNNEIKNYYKTWNAVQIFRNFSLFDDANKPYKDLKNIRLNVINDRFTHNNRINLPNLSSEYDVFISPGNDFGKLLYNDEPIDKNDVFIRAINISTEKYDTSIFTHPLYLTSGYMYETSEDNGVKQLYLYAQAYLFIESMIAMLCSSFKPYTDNKSWKMKIFRKIDILFYGALCVRMAYFKSTNKDLLSDYQNIHNVHGGNFNEGPFHDNNTIYTITNVNGFKHKSFEDIMGISYDRLEKYEKNVLINEFVLFVNKEFKTIKSLCDVRTTDNTVISTPLIWDYVLKIQQAFDEKVKENNGVERGVAIELKTLSAPTIKFGQAIDYVFCQASKSVIQNTTYNGERWYLYLQFGEDSTLQSILKSLLFDLNIAIVLNNNLPESKQYSLNIENEVYTSYLNGFVNQMQKFKEDFTEESVLSSTTENYDKDLDDGLLTMIYMYCKNIWEKWLLPLKGEDVPVNQPYKIGTNETIKGDDYYNVENFFDYSFTFIDSYYNDISRHLMINLDVFYDTYIKRKNDKNLFSFLTDITKKHKCLFVGLPDYCHLGMGINEKNPVSAEETMKKMFTPMPYSQIEYPKNNNNFVVMYTYPPSSKIPEEISYKYDGFDLDAKTEESKNTLNKLFANENFAATRNTTYKPSDYGYTIPSFAVTYGRQNNHMFKSLNLSMDNPVETEHSIFTLAQAAQKAKGRDRTIAFYGQDVYNIYSNYSYQVDVEMMGNAQIQPLMYFQLMNMPMWNGAYMIHTVKHTLKPGDMTTTFTGMKLSKYPVPLLTTFWTKMKPYDGMQGLSYAKTDNVANDNERQNNTSTSNINSATKVLMFGDSTTVHLANWMSAWGKNNGFEVKSVTIVSATIENYTTESYVNGITQIINKWKPDFIMVSLGTNNVSGTISTSNVSTFVEKVKGFKIPWVWIGPAHYKNAKSEYANNAKDLNTSATNSGAKHIYCWDNVESGGADGIHPSNSESKAWVEYVVGKLPQNGIGIIKTSEKPTSTAKCKNGGTSKGSAPSVFPLNSVLEALSLN